jgi:hypothetical protein
MDTGAIQIVPPPSTIPSLASVYFYDENTWLINLQEVQVELLAESER